MMFHFYQVGYGLVRGDFLRIKQPVVHRLSHGVMQRMQHAGFLLWHRWDYILEFILAYGKTFPCPCIVGIVKHFIVPPDLQVSQEIHQCEAKAMLQGEQEVRQQELAEVVGIPRCQSTIIVVHLCETH